MMGDDIPAGTTNAPPTGTSAKHPAAIASPNPEMGRVLDFGGHIVRHLNVLRRLILLFVAVLMAAVVILTAAQLAWTIVKDAFAPFQITLSLIVLFKVLGTFALVLIAIELFETTLKAYSADVNHAELILRVAIIAAARHAILTDYERASSQAMVGLAAVILSLTVGVYFMKRASAARFVRTKECERGGEEGD